MKTFLVFFLFLSFSCTSKNEMPKTSVNLIEGDTLDQWDFILEDSLLAKSDIWHIKDGVLYCSGAVNGYIYTKKEYADYKLNFEWRWSEEPGNSGVLLHIDSPDRIWPLCIEAQLQADNAGDFIMMGGSTIKELPDTTSRKVVKLNDSNEKDAGGWNHYEIICNKDSIKVLINGVMQNKASQASLQKGKIGLQSEGKPIQFKNIFLEAL